MFYVKFLVLIAIGHSVIFSSAEEDANRSAPKSVFTDSEDERGVGIFMSFVSVLPEKDDEILAFWQMVYATDKKAIGIFIEFYIRTVKIKQSVDTKKSMIERDAHQVLFNHFEWWPDNWWESLKLEDAKYAYAKGYRYYPTLLQVRENIRLEIESDGGIEKTQEKLSRKEGKLSHILKSSTLLVGFVGQLDEKIVACSKYLGEIRELEGDRISPVLKALPSPRAQVSTLSLFNSE